MEWVIVILIACVFAPGEKDAVEVLSYRDRPMVFKTHQECRAHVELNRVALLEFASMHFPKNTVKSIECFERSNV